MAFPRAGDRNGNQHIGCGDDGMWPHLQPQEIVFITPGAEPSGGGRETGCVHSLHGGVLLGSQVRQTGSFSDTGRIHPRTPSKGRLLLTTK